jgi:hypothetical protein
MVLLCAALGVLAAAPDATTKTVEADGEAALINGNKTRAIEDAKVRALVQAVEQAAGVYVRSDTELHDGTLVQDLIASHAQGYVKSFDWHPVDGPEDVAKVHVKAQVLVAPLKDEISALEALRGRMNGLKLRLALDEHEYSGARVGTPVTDALVAAFTADGWQVSRDQTAVDFTLYGSVVYQVHDPREAGARPQRELEGTAEFSLLHTTTAAQLCKSNIHAGPLPKVEIADIAAQLVPMVLHDARQAFAQFLKDAPKGGEVRLLVANMTFSDVGPLSDALGKLPGVTLVQENDFEKGVQQYRVMFTGTPQELGARLAKTKAGTRAFKVFNVGPGLIRGGLL